MNHFDLEKHLRTASVPERPSEYWEEFPGRVLERLRTRPAIQTARSSWVPTLAWSFGMACVCLVIGFWLGHLRGRSGSDSFAALQNAKTLREILTVFPNRVRAIVQDETGVKLVLSDAPDVPVSSPIWIRVDEGKNHFAVVTFSGQELEIARKKVEVLLDAQGHVILVGDQFVWSSTGPSHATDGLRIQARSLDNVM